MLFKQSIREQRIRFYGNSELNRIVYSNSRLARDPPAKISGDETITRLYTRKATDIRMRTAKKNESGILNQNLCGSNKGYKNWKEGDPVGSGYTFANVAYPGASYCSGSMFREKDMGRLVELIFISDNYFRYRDVELVADSHFGHLVPLIFLRLWKIHATTSFNPSQRIGLSNLEELCKKKLTKEELSNLAEEEEKEEVMEMTVFDPLVSSESESDVKPYAEKIKVRKGKKVHSRLQFFEKKLSKKPKGTYKVWALEYRLLDLLRVTIFLHAVNDSKPVFRISNKYAALPADITKVNPETGKKISEEISASPAHKSFRYNMGYNDQSDAKRSYIGLSSKYYKRWPQHIVAKTLEDTIINAYCNYLLDTNCPNESWPDFLYTLVQEFLDRGDNLRSKQLHPISYKRTYITGLKRPRPGSESALEKGKLCRGGLHIGSQKEVPARLRTKRCAFCGRAKARFKCRSCGSHLCVGKPQDSREGQKYPQNGPSCYLRYHGLSSFPRG